MLVDAIIQARMTSSRLPGKVLAPVMGRPLLAYQLARLSRAKRIGRIILATTVNADDDPVAELAKANDVPVYRGSEPDVLDRYYQAAREYRCENVMRVTGDCPLIDPADCDRVVDHFLNMGLDYVQTGPSFAEGLDCEVMTFRALERSWHDARLDFEREHVTSYIRHHRDIFSTDVLENDVDDRAYRITVDTPEDFEVVKAVFEALYPDYGEAITMTHIRSFFAANPEVFALNSDIVRNEARVKAATRGQVPEKA